MIGFAFGVDKASVDVFSESFIRSHLMFQLAKGLETLLARVRATLRLPPLTLISKNSKNSLIVGAFVQTSNIYAAQGEVVFLERADGTEEIPSRVKAVVLKH